MAGQKSGKAPGQTPYAPGGAEVWSDSDRDYFTDPHFHREGSLEQTKQQWKDQDRLEKEKAKLPKFQKGGAVKPVSPNFTTREFGVGTMHTRKGRGLIEDDLPSDLSSAKPGPYGAHARGGMVQKHGSSTCVHSKTKG